MVRRRHCGRAAVLLAGALLAAGAGAQELPLFGAASREASGFSLGLEPFAVALVPVVPGDPPGGGDSAGAGEARPSPPPSKRCVLFQCQTLPIEPAEKVFTTGTTLWTAAGVFGGFVDGIQGPAHYGFSKFHFTDEAYFQYWTYGGGSDKASHFVISSTVSGLLFDAYRLNGLTEDQAFALALGTSVMAGALVEIGDGLTPYGFSAQDWTADALGSLAGAVIQRAGAGDLLGFRLGKIPTTIPAALTRDRTLFGIGYSNEIYSFDMTLAGLGLRAHQDPGIARYFLVSFVYLTKGFGYDPVLPSRYQEVGGELGLNFPAILEAAGVSNETWWGDFLLRAFRFFRIPYTQIGAYYNLKNNKWYGPGAPYHYY